MFPNIKPKKYAKQPLPCSHTQTCTLTRTHESSLENGYIYVHAQSGEGLVGHKPWMHTILPIYNCSSCRRLTVNLIECTNNTT